MDLKSLIAVCVFIAPCIAVRLEYLFKLLDGTESDPNLHSFLHIGNDYSVLLRKPANNDKHFIYELYETQNTPNAPISYDYKPNLLAISEIPIEYVKEQLRIFKEELRNATTFDDSLVPGTQVKTLREWQIEKALRMREEIGTNTPLRSEPLILRTQID